MELIEFRILSEAHMTDNRNVIIACDFSSAQACMEFLSRFERERPWVKVGMELYYAEGPAIVRSLKERGHPVFLDLKLHDIPNTVKKAMRVLSDLGADMVNLHAAGTRTMMEAAREGLGDSAKLLAVTMLTSTDQLRMEREIMIPAPMEDVVLHYAKNAAEAGLDGVVCSPLEAGKVHSVCGSSFLAVTPGVRFADSSVGDQVRVTTPEAARELGSDYIVVGRPITQAADPYAAWRRCIKEFCSPEQDRENL